MNIQIGINYFSAHANSVMRMVCSNDEPLLVTRRREELLVALLPWRGTRRRREVPMRELSRNTFSVIADVRETSEPVTITKYGKPIGEIAPLSAEAERRYAAAVAAQSRELIASLVEADAGFDRAKTLDNEFIDSLPETGQTAPRRPSAARRLEH
jgi:prevent-host-death family protein